MPNFDRSLQISDAQRASSSSTSISSNSSYADRPSNVSQFTDLTTPFDSVNSIFGNNPELQPVPRFPDLLPWDGLSDEQWKLHSLEYTIEQAERDILFDLGEDYLREDIWYDLDLYKPVDDFDAVAAVRARLAKGEQTSTTVRALEIIDSRSRIAPTKDRNPEPMTRKNVAEKIEDFELGDDGVFDIPTTPHGRHSVLEPIFNESREPDSLFNVTFPSPFLDIAFSPSPLPTCDMSTSTPNFIPKLMTSPLVLNHPAIIRKIEPRSPIISISSFLLTSHLPLPASLLDESWDEVAARLHISDTGNVTPRPDTELSQEHGLGLIGLSTPITWNRPTSCAMPFIDEPSRDEVLKSQVDDMKGVVENISESSVSPFQPARSSWDVSVKAQSIMPYIPTALGSTIGFTDLPTNIGFGGGNTVTAGSSHPAAAASFTSSTNEASKAEAKVKGLGLGLPLGVEQRVSRCCSSGIPASEACQDLVNLAASASPMESSSLQEFRGHVLSPIIEEATPQPDPCPAFTLETKLMPSRKKPAKKRRKVFKRFLSFFF